MRAFLARQPLGITAQGDDDLAAHVQPGIVVEAQPLIFKAIAHEDERGGDVEMGFGGVHADQHVAAMREALRPGRTGDGQRRWRLRAFGLLELIRCSQPPPGPSASPAGLRPRPSNWLAT